MSSSPRPLCSTASTPSSTVRSAPRPRWSRSSSRARSRRAPADSRRGRCEEHRRGHRRAPAATVNLCPSPVAQIGPNPCLGIIMKKVQRVLGGNVRVIVTGSAPLGPETQKFVQSCFACPVRQARTPPAPAPPPRGPRVHVARGSLSVCCRSGLRPHGDERGDVHPAPHRQLDERRRPAAGVRVHPAPRLGGGRLLQLRPQQGGRARAPRRGAHRRSEHRDGVPCGLEQPGPGGCQEE